MSKQPTPITLIQCLFAPINVILDQRKKELIEKNVKICSMLMPDITYNTACMWWKSTWLVTKNPSKSAGISSYAHESLHEEVREFTTFEDKVKRDVHLIEMAFYSILSKSTSNEQAEAILSYLNKNYLMYAWENDPYIESTYTPEVMECVDSYFKTFPIIKNKIDNYLGYRLLV